MLVTSYSHTSSVLLAYDCISCSRINCYISSTVCSHILLAPDYILVVEKGTAALFHCSYSHTSTMLLAPDYITCSRGDRVISNAVIHQQYHHLTASAAVDSTATPVVLYSHTSGILLYLTASSCSRCDSWLCW